MIRQFCPMHDDLVEEIKHEGADILFENGALLLLKHRRFERMIKEIFSAATILQMCIMKAFDCRDT